MHTKTRKYKSGTAWCFWRWSEVDSEYIMRLHIVKTPWFAICLHWLNKPDPEPYMHDHPVTFLSVILRGGYTEKRCLVGKYFGLVQHRWFNWITADSGDRHTITHVEPGTLTLCFMGPKTRDWGFHQPAEFAPVDEAAAEPRVWRLTPAKWVMWKDYYATQRAAKRTELK